jgi:hypothetical protein
VKFTEGADMIQVVHEAIGAASVCWSEYNEERIFDDKKAKEVAAALLEYLQEQGFKKNLEDMQAEVVVNNRANGWYDEDRTFGEDVALLHSEVSEMLEAYRDFGHDEVYRSADGRFAENFRNPDGTLNKPEGMGSEAADVYIRLLDTCARRGIDLRAKYEEKSAYNQTRGYRHGGKRL